MGADHGLYCKPATKRSQRRASPGFIRRRLLQPRAGGTYVAIVEHDSDETFLAMHSPTQAEAFRRLEPLLAGRNTPSFYEVVMG